MHLVLGLVGSIVAGALIALLLVQGSHAINQESARRAAGSLVWTATATDLATPLDGTTCTRLAVLDGVAAAGGQSSTGLPELSAFPGGQPLPLTGLTPGAAQVFAPRAPWAATTVGADLAALNEVGDGSWLIDQEGARAQQVTAVISQAPIGALTSSVVVPIAPDAPLDACWIRMNPAAVAYGHDILATAYPDGVAAVAPFVRQQAGDVPPAQVWKRTVDQQPWLLAAAAVAAAAALALWARRTDLAVYRTFGTPRSAVVMLVVIENTLALAPAPAAGTLLGVLAHAMVTGSGALPALVVTAVAQAVAATLTALLIGVGLTIAATRGNVTDILRDR
ncbi:hypothetical protein [Cellulomonas sp. PhB150]|uniref:hypothetical protein n=1 Tax=Cellulomonas sp. PhB150 TaxID=2485188 RepID=UPI000F482224|nr:hypothetical protein [Cellulomonas sp. PhB150]